MLLGPTGAGKSRTGNNLLGVNTAFKVGNGGRVVTVKCKSHTSERFGKQLYIIDTPGIYGEQNETKKLIDEIKRGLHLSNEGLHVFLLLTEMGRAVDFHKLVVRYQNLFGEKMFKHVIVVFTNFDVWKDRFKDDHDQEPDVDQYLKSLPEDAMNVFGKCGNRYVVFDNKCKGDEMERQLGNLIEKMKNLITFNKGEVYIEERQEDDHQNDMPRNPGNGWSLKVFLLAGFAVVSSFFFARYSR